MIAVLGDVPARIVVFAGISVLVVPAMLLPTSAWLNVPVDRVMTLVAFEVAVPEGYPLPTTAAPAALSVAVRFIVQASSVSLITRTLRQSATAPFTLLPPLAVALYTPSTR